MKISKRKMFKSNANLKKMESGKSLMDTDEIFNKAEENLKFFNDNFTEFERSYPNKFVAISGSTLITTGETSEAILVEIEKRGINRSDLLVEFIPLPGSSIIL